MTSAKLGQILIQRKLIRKNELVQALAEQKRLHQKFRRQLKLGQILLYCEVISVDDLEGALLEQGPRDPSVQKNAQAH